MSHEMPADLKKLQQLQWYIAKEQAVISVALAQSTEGRNVDVLGILGDGEYKEKKRFILPALNVLGTCDDALTEDIIPVIKKYWRLRWRAEKANNTRKLEDLERGLQEFETFSHYAFFQARYNKAKKPIDAAFNQYATALAMVGAQKEDKPPGGMEWVASSEDALVARTRSQKMSEKELGILKEKAKRFRFPTFHEAVEMARMELIMKEEVPEEKQIKTKGKGKTKKKARAKKTEPAQRTARPITSALQGSRTLST